MWKQKISNTSLEYQVQTELPTIGFGYQLFWDRIYSLAMAFLGTILWRFLNYDRLLFSPYYYFFCWYICHIGKQKKINRYALSFRYSIMKKNWKGHNWSSSQILSLWFLRHLSTVISQASTNNFYKHIRTTSFLRIFLSHKFKLYFWILTLPSIRKYLRTKGDLKWIHSRMILARMF